MRHGTVYEMLTEEICSECLAANEDCLPGSRECQMSTEMKELSAICEKVEELATRLMGYVQRYAPDEPPED